MELLAKLWTHGGGEKPVVRTWLLKRSHSNFEETYDHIQDDLEDVSGADDFTSGMHVEY